MRCPGGSYPFALGRIAHGYDTRPDLCAARCSGNPRSYTGRFYVDSLVHDPTALLMLLDVVGQVGRSIDGLTESWFYVPLDTKRERRFARPISWLGMEKTQPNATKARIHQSTEMYYNTK